MKEVKDLVAEYSAKLALNISACLKPRNGPVTFFMRCHYWLIIRHVFAEDRSVLPRPRQRYMLRSCQKAPLTMTENKVTAEASEAYTKAREELERMTTSLILRHFTTFTTTPTYFTVNRSNRR